LCPPLYTAGAPPRNPKPLTDARVLTWICAPGAPTHPPQHAVRVRAPVLAVCAARNRTATCAHFFPPHPPHPTPFPPSPPDDPSKGWCPEFFTAVGLGDLPAGGFARVGRSDAVAGVGAGVGAGLTPAAAAHLGLAQGTPVAAGMIDAHAGGLAATSVAVPTGGCAGAGGGG
jgi:hypothetical protein